VKFIAWHTHQVQKRKIQTISYEAMWKSQKKRGEKNIHINLLSCAEWDMGFSCKCSRPYNSTFIFITMLLIFCCFSLNSCEAFIASRYLWNDKGCLCNHVWDHSVKMLIWFHIRSHCLVNSNYHTEICASYMPHYTRLWTSDSCSYQFPIDNEVPFE
jgi:hypothetical protein